MDNKGVCHVEIQGRHGKKENPKFKFESLNESKKYYVSYWLYDTSIEHSYFDTRNRKAIQKELDNMYGKGATEIVSIELETNESLKEDIANLERVKDKKTVQNVVMADAEQFSKDKNTKETKKLTDPMELKNNKAFLGASKQPVPKDAKVPNEATNKMYKLSENLFEDYEDYQYRFDDEFYETLKPLVYRYLNNGYNITTKDLDRAFEDFKSMFFVDTSNDPQSIFYTNYTESLKEGFWNSSREFDKFTNFMGDRVDYSKWNDMSQEERDELVTSAIQEFVDTYKDSVVWQLLLDDLTDHNWHTEHRILLDILDKNFVESLNETKMYDLAPNNSGRKSYYGKAKVVINDDGSETLYSYNTPIMTRYSDGSFKKHWNDWSATTGRHIKEFSGLDKKGYSKLESLEKKSYDLLGEN